MLVSLVAGLALIAWAHLVLFHGRFWRGDQHLDPTPGAGLAIDPPRVAAIVPARNEAETIETTLRALLDQDYAGAIDVHLVDDHSEDATADLARAVAERAQTERAGAEGVAIAGSAWGPRRLVVHGAPPLPTGWSGKLWAVSTGVDRATADPVEAARYLLLTDADIVHAPGSVRALVAKAEGEGRDMVSLMAHLWHRGFWAGLLIPAFVFFFQKLYPFAKVNDRHDPTAAAAGGCVLVRAGALAEAGGVQAIKGALIDDCALARLVKRRRGPEDLAPIWLGLTTAARSLRPYDGLGDVWRMVARTAFDQLGYSSLLLVGTVLGMVLLYLAPPLVALTTPLHGHGWAGAMALGAWALMAIAYWPTLRLYGKSPLVGALLPLAGLLYTAMTVDSARRHWTGRGGAWKGRTHGPAGAAGSPSEAATGAS